MQLARVIGHAVATVKHPSLTGWKLLLVQPLHERRTPDGDPFLAVHAVGPRLAPPARRQCDGTERPADEADRLANRAGPAIRRGAECDRCPRPRRADVRVLVRTWLAVVGRSSRSRRQPRSGGFRPGP